MNIIETRIPARFIASLAVGVGLEQAGGIRQKSQPDPSLERSGLRNALPEAALPAEG
jgi:hypothetical protein